MTFSRLRIPILTLTLAAACLACVIQGMLVSSRISGSENTPLWTQTSGPPGVGFPGASKALRQILRALPATISPVRLPDPIGQG